MFLHESGNIFLLLVSSDSSSSVAACAAMFIVLQHAIRCEEVLELSLF